MKKDTTYVAQEKFIQIVNELGIKSQVQSGWTKIGNWENGLFVYVPNGKSVAKVNLAGFETQHPGARLYTADERPTGQVKQGLDFSRSEEDILNAFREIVTEMVGLPKPEKQKRPAPMASKQAAKEALSAHVPSPPKEDKAARLALIERVAREKGVPVSPKTYAALSADMADES